MIFFEHGPEERPALFMRPERLVRAETASDVPAALEALDRARTAGKWLAGFASYELGYALEPRLAPLMPPAVPLPLLQFGVFAAPEPGEAFLARAEAEAPESGLSPPLPDWSPEEHERAIRRVLDYVGSGDIYQANLTFRMSALATGTPAGVYGALRARQRVRYAAFLDMPETPAILSRSPELFFETDASGRIETRPMKGTAPRDPDPARDDQLRLELEQSVKNRAENLMIVDLLRNDISRICRVGSVRVPDLFRVESYATVHQMVSRVVGELLPGTRPSDIFRAIFPCGSITGAPKIRAMEIIRELEPTPRGIYCGAIGWLAPDGRSSFNVAIRTLMLAADGTATFGVGGGIVQDSTPASEYEEALWKTRFARLAPA